VGIHDRDCHGPSLRPLRSLAGTAGISRSGACDRGFSYSSARMTKRQIAGARRNSPRFIACVLAAVATIHFPATATAEEGPSRLRVTERDASRVVGTFGGLRGDTLLLMDRSHGAPYAIAFPAIETLERSRGIHGHGLAGAAIGFCAGAIVGGVIGAALQPREGSGSDSHFAAGGAILIGTAGAVVGALAGRGWRSEVWRPMPVQELHLLVGLSTPGAPEVILAKHF
jgi:hypothetical protein